MRCIVTGGAGFIGSNLVDRLVNDNHEVIVFDNLSTGKQENINEKAKFFLVDISHQSYFEDEKMKEIMTGVDVVFHTAALARVQPSIENPIEFNNVNVGGTLNMLKACVDYGVKRFIYSSSSSVYGDVEQLPTPEEHKLNPMSPYALQKLIGEQYCKLYSELHGLETACLRYFNVYGKRMSLELNGDSFNIGNGDNRSVNEIANMIGGDSINVEPVIEPKETLADNNKAKRVLGFNPSITIEDWIPTWKKEKGL